MERLRRAVWLVLAAATAALDLWSKALWVYPHDDFYPTNKTVLDGWLYIRTTWNEGGVWSSDLPKWLLLWGSALAVPALLLWLFWSRSARTWDNAAKALVLGGAVGNLYDRWRWDRVRDWVDVVLFGWHYPTFNVADAALVVGIAILLLDSFRRRPEARS
jgi:signal peptidase II